MYLKEIRVFSNPNKFSFMTEVNNFIKSTEYEICDMQYGISGGLLAEYSVMIIIDVNDEAQQLNINY